MRFTLQHGAFLLFPLIRSFLRSHNLEYDSSEEKNPRLIFYNEEDEVVKVRRESGGAPVMGLIWGDARTRVRFERARPMGQMAPV